VFTKRERYKQNVHVFIFLTFLISVDRLYLQQTVALKKRAEMIGSNKVLRNGVGMQI